MSENSSPSVSCGAACQHTERGNFDMKTDYMNLVRRLHDASDLINDKVSNVSTWGQFEKPNGDGDMLSGEQLWDEYVALRASVWGEMSDDSSLQYLHSQHAKEYRRKWGWPDFQPGVGVYRELSRLYPEHASELRHDLTKHQAIDSAWERLNSTITICTSVMERERLPAAMLRRLDAYLSRLTLGALTMPAAEHHK
ncbi:hypothetical protein LTS07_006109 [Exophiala sideris]|uniref:Uncharacterized protein n=1 Tax=Exophiala sideris TaxID=1016849 RepID=A0ABR0J5Z9_9EURO|nr:hypothetical protein LTS07_006109 [Exophiala sideris]KAK5035598.1 hypothetical protein LTR13_005727 [Exophiala sideris]KAK5057234.1 hypothetical protein LTR69_007273 [Exophiala sideris]KAK5181793.1 hypothetical protein LTR44_005993 [Eurotiomycetes sp. CCFEE 6388]